MTPEVRTESHYGNGYALLLWAEKFRDGRMPNFPDAWIAVLPVIAAHANENREAWPGYARICALAQVSRTTLNKAISGLVEKDWIARFSRKTGKNTHNCYRLLWNTDLDSRQYIALHHDLIFSGVWGKMRPSDRKVYLMLRAFSWRGGHAIPDGFIGGSPEDHIEGEQVGIFHNANFLPAHVYDPAEFQILSGINARTFRDSFAWLIDNKLVLRVGEYEDLEPGLLIPFMPGRYAPDIKQKVADTELEKEHNYAKASSGAKRSLTRAWQRQRRNDFGNEIYRREMLDAESDTNGSDSTAYMQTAIVPLQTAVRVPINGNICTDKRQ